MIQTFLLIGQSNMAGRGGPGEVPDLINPDVLMFRDGAWRPAVEPLHADKPELAGIGPGMSFADSVQRHHGGRVGVVPCAFGGSALREWQPGERLFVAAAASTRAALRADGVLRGILWHQGESDSDTRADAETYDARFWTLYRPLMEQIGGEGIPFIVGELGAFLERYPAGCDFYRVTNRKLAAIAASAPHFEWASARGLTDGGDHLHFSAAAQRVFGLRYAEAWERAAARLGIRWS